MLTSSRGTWLLGISFAALAACTASRSGDPTAEGVSEHTVGEPVTLNNRYVWAEVSDADFGKGMSSPGGAASAPLAKNDPATQRVQAWLDRYHAIIGQVLAERGQTLVAPKPNAALVKQYGPNAWVSSAIACPAGWTVRPTSSFGGAGANLLLTPDYAYGVDLEDQCISPANWTDKNAFVSFWNSQPSACRLDVDVSDTLTVSGGGCNMYGRTAPLATYATSSTIAVTLDAITWGKEERVADTLAHELGHYYRAHSNPIVARETEFFYRDDPSGPDRPVPIAESATYQNIIQQIRRVPPPVRIKSKTRYNKRLAVSLYSMRSLCPNATISENVMRSIMSGQITPTNTNTYLAFENVVASCARGLSMADPATSDQLQTILRNGRVYLELDAGAASVDDALLSLTAQLDEIDRQEASLVAKMSTGTFGWYTDEQEADEIGLELAARAGLSPDVVIAGNVRTYEQLDALYRQAGVDRGDEVTMETCKKWLAAGFTEKGPDGATRPVRVPIGSLSDTHHDGCYRIYNLWREAKRHGYTVAPPLPALTPSWDTVQAHVLTLGGTKPPAASSNPGGGDSGGTGTPEPNGGANGDDGENTPDPEDSAPPPRRPKAPSTSNGAASSEGSDAGVTTMTKTTSGCASTSGSTQGGPMFAAGVSFALALILRRRRQPASTS